jgi:hypothetical protein
MKKTLSNNNDNNKIKSIDGNNCVGPCYPKNTFYYNPYNLVLTKSDRLSCPIKPQKKINSDGKIEEINSNFCYDKDINKGHLYFDIFNDSVQISTSSNNFLKEIYRLNNIEDIVHFLSNSIEILPIYSQRRILKAIFEVYYKYPEFPKLLFSKKLLFILINIYKINNLDKNIIVTKLNNIQNLDNDFYSYFI